MAERSEAMMQAIEGSGVTYEQLAEMEKQFDDAETEISKCVPETDMELEEWENSEEVQVLRTIIVRS